MPYVQRSESGEIIALSEQVVKPFYQQKATFAVQLLREAIPDPRFHIHKPEGALFLWLWFEDLPIHCQELYERLKAKNLLIVPGHYFFPGIDAEFERTREAILAIKRRDELLADDYRLRLSIRLRNPYVDPISLLQVDLLARWRAAGRPEDALFHALVTTVNGIAAGVQNTG